MTDDAKLLTDYARRGDTNALSTLIVRHSPWMSAILRGMLPDPDVEDALQDSWLKVIRAARDFRGEGIKSYLARVVRSVAIDRLRVSGRTVSLDAEVESASTEDEDALFHELKDESPLPNERFESSATKADILAAIRALAEGPRQVLLLRIESEMPFREIAATLHVPLGTALTWMHTATQFLKTTLGESK